MAQQSLDLRVPAAELAPAGAVVAQVSATLRCAAVHAWTEVWREWDRYSWHVCDRCGARRVVDHRPPQRERAITQDAWNWLLGKGLPDA